MAAETLFLSWETQALRSGRVESSTDSIESTLTAIRNVIVGDAVRCAAERNARRSGALRLFVWCVRFSLTWFAVGFVGGRRRKTTTTTTTTFYSERKRRAHLPLL